MRAVSSIEIPISHVAAGPEPMASGNGPMKIRMLEDAEPVPEKAVVTTMISIPRMVNANPRATRTREIELF